MCVGVVKRREEGRGTEKKAKKNGTITSIDERERERE